jgi:hypothetical protein
MVFEYERGKLSFDENPLKHTFVAKNDISETIHEREIIKLKPKSVYSLLKKIKASKVYKKYLTVDMDKFRIQWCKPKEF